MKFLKLFDWEFVFNFVVLQIPFYCVMYMYTSKRSVWLEDFQSIVVCLLYFVLSFAMHKINKIEIELKKLKCKNEKK